jgi:hypothetical protein
LPVAKTPFSGQIARAVLTRNPKVWADVVKWSKLIIPASVFRRLPKKLCKPPLSDRIKTTEVYLNGEKGKELDEAAH